MVKYTIINQTDDYIACVGIYEDYYKAVGALSCKLHNCIEDWLKEGYKLISKKEFCELETDSGYGWFVELINEKNKNKINEEWYLLEYEEEEK